MFQTVNEAKHDCENRKECKGVLDIDCNGQQDYYICLENATVTTDNDKESCFYDKYIIGKNPFRIGNYRFSNKLYVSFHCQYAIVITL